MRRMLSVSFLNEMPLYRDKYHSIVGLFDNRKKKIQPENLLSSECPDGWMK